MTKRKAADDDTKQAVAPEWPIDKVELCRDPLGWRGPQSGQIMRPELAALEWYKAQGWDGQFDEGAALLTLIKSASFDVIPGPFVGHAIEGIYKVAWERRPKKPILGDVTRIGAFTISFPGLEEWQRAWQITPEELLDAVRNNSDEAILRNFQQVQAGGIDRERELNLSRAHVKTLLDLLGRERLLQLVTIFATDPYGYRGGWPDLTLTRDTDLLFVEVKSPKDRLQKAQRRLRTEVLLPLGLPARLCRLTLADDAAA